MNKKGLLGPLRSNMVVTIALGFVLAGVVHDVAASVVSGLLNSLLNKMNMSGDGVSLPLGAIIGNVLAGALAIAGVLLFAKWCGDEKADA